MNYLQRIINESVPKGKLGQSIAYQYTDAAIIVGTTLLTKDPTIIQPVAFISTLIGDAHEGINVYLTARRSGMNRFSSVVAGISSMSFRSMRNYTLAAPELLGVQSEYIYSASAAMDLTRLITRSTIVENGIEKHTQQTIRTNNSQENTK